MSDRPVGAGSAGEWEVLDVGALATVQDAGRPGLAHLGVPRGGWLDAPAASLANRLVGNDVGMAVVEVAVGGLRLRAGGAAWVAVTGAWCAVSVDGRPRGHGEPVRVPPGGGLALGPATRGVRSYVAFAGGVAVEPVLGSRSTDTLAWVGPPQLEAGSRLPVGVAGRPPPAVDVAVTPTPRGPLRLLPGPRAEWCVDPLIRLSTCRWVVLPASDRVGMRLDGPPLRRVPEREDVELPSEGVVLGAVQVPPDGRPVVFLADHPTTGGYPVVAVVHPGDLPRCAQLAPGDEVRFAGVRPGG